MPIEQDTLAKYPNRVFIETGTYMGLTVEKALNVGFERVYSIEIDDKLAADATEKFAGDDRVTICHGDTLTWLPKILADVDEPVTLWLDAHASGPLLGGDVPYPIINELLILAQHPIKDHTILIDDLRLVETEWRMQKQMIIGAIRQISDRYMIGFEAGIIPNDVLVAVPPEKVPGDQQDLARSA